MISSSGSFKRYFVYLWTYRKCVDCHIAILLILNSDCQHLLSICRSNISTPVGSMLIKWKICSRFKFPTIRITLDSWLLTLSPTLPYPGALLPLSGKTRHFYHFWSRDSWSDNDVYVDIEGKQTTLGVDNDFQNNFNLKKSLLCPLNFQLKSKRQQGPHSNRKESSMTLTLNLCIQDGH